MNYLVLKPKSLVAAGAILALAAAGCRLADQPSPQPDSAASLSSKVGHLESIDPRFDDLVSPAAEIEVLAGGFNWSEGPVWIPGADYLLFSDVPENIIYRWSERDSLEPWLEPSGNTGFATGAREGSNGLLLDPSGRLVLLQHGDRRVAQLATPLEQPEPKFETVASHYQGKRFNSPNDAAYRSNGDLYFTDPPYGLQDSSQTELGFNGVYRFSRAGELTLLTSELTRPNGIAFSPDEKTLYVANSDPTRAIWMAYDVTADGGVANGRIFFDATALTADRPGLPDGLKVDAVGNLFATGPGGVLVFDAAGTHLGTIWLSMPAANCAFGDSGSTLYITADDYLLRVALLTSGKIGPPRARS
jgi:gluconolactonase